MSKYHGIVASALAALFAACGGSGSTGLIAPEGALLAEVRRDGTCVTAEESITYCATDSPGAVAPGGASADGPRQNGGGAVATATPGAGGPTPSPGGATAAPTASAPAASPTGPQQAPTPTPQPTPCPPGDETCLPAVELTFVVRGFPEGAVCALAARTAGSASEWSIGSPVPAGGAEVTIAPPLPTDVTPGLVEVALLCFDMAPASLPARVEALADARPDVVFVPVEPVAITPPA